MLSVSTRQAYTEIDNLIELLDEYYKNKIPKKLREFFKREKDNNYIKVIDPKLSIKEQKLKKETLALIAMINLQYWCEDEEEKKRLNKIYTSNEIKYQEELRKKYDPEKLFKNNKEILKENIEVCENNLPVEIKKESCFRKLINFIKNILRFD